MQKYKYLIKNIGLLTISKFGSKILNFILIPLYTNLLSTVEYGTYDIYSTTISLMIPVLTLQIVDGVVRFSLDESNDKAAVFSIGLKRILVSCGIVAIIAMLNANLKIIEILAEYPLCLFLMYTSEILYSLLSQFSRGIERINDLAIAGIINSATMLCLNILFLARFQMGLEGYFYANIIAYVVPAIFLLTKIKAWTYIRINTNKSLSKEMNAYSKPMVFNNLAWWVNNASDRYIVTWLCGAAENGIYSISYKIPSLLNVFQEIFSQAWTLSAVKEYNAKNSDFYTTVYGIYNFAMVFTCSCLIIVDKLIAKILFSQEFYTAWTYAPFLMISVLFGSLSGLIGGIFSAAKKSNVFARTTILGASVNTVLNIGLVYFMGPMGAAVATLISYILVWAARIYEAKKIVELSINLKRDIIAYCLLLAQAVTLFTNMHLLWQSCLLLIPLLIILRMYNGLIKKFLLRLVRKK